MNIFSRYSFIIDLLLAGYGHIYPATKAGRVATMAYALVGIPLCLIVLTELGKFLTLCLKTLYVAFNGSRRRGSDVFVVDSEYNFTLGASLFLSGAYIWAGVAMYRSWEEDWDFLEAFYFIFVSVSTVGFGDVLPSDQRLFALSFVYQLFGLALVSLLFNVVMETQQKHLTPLTERVVTSLVPAAVAPSGGESEKKDQ